MAAVHRLVLTRPELALCAYYPSVTARAYDPGGAEPLWGQFGATLTSEASTIRELVARPCQTNEVGRCAALVAGFLFLTHRFARPLRMLEIGASGGLNLRWDQYRYGGGGSSWGPDDSPVQLTSHWKTPPPHTELAITVAERVGCDPSPIEPTSAEGHLALKASLWADQLERHQRLEAAIAIAGRFPARVEAASADDWLATQLATPVAGVTTVVYHSIVEEYFRDAVRERFHATLAQAARRASIDAPLAWLRLEAVTSLRSHGLECSLWPTNERLVLARCGAHGTDVEWCLA
ncbi:MAG: DUF2332 domain-containing protein [Bradymonadaceae bacterium]|nr:DUF2332 domain-containing protein [Lujinxingiaceae bacterium]